MKVFLDDIRNPKDCAKYMHSRIGKHNLLYMDKWYVVRNYDEFVDLVSKSAKNVTHVSFSHDLADEHYTTPNQEYSADQYDRNVEIGLYTERTGFDAAKWMKEYFESNNLPLPTIFVHSMNPVGRQNIEWLFSNKQA